MPISQALCSSFKQELFSGVHNFTTDNIYIALYTSFATLGATTTAYSVINEVTGTNYTAGGQVLANPVITLSGTTAFIDFNDPVWALATITARGALIYNASKANRAIAVLDFGADKTSTDGDFVIELPANDALNAIIRFA
jgi:hypothetical protein